MIGGQIMEQNDTQQQISDYAFAEKQFVSGHAKDAFPVISQFAEQGDPWARYLLACYYHMGYDTVPIDHARRNSLCAQAETYDEPMLMYGFAVWCLKEDQKPCRDQYMAAIFDRLLKRAEFGDTAAQYIVGKMYMDGDAVEQDYAASAKWFRLGAESGYAAAQNALGWLYIEGKGVEQDTAKAIGLLQSAAMQGYANAQMNLGILYANGIGVSKNNAEALEWYRKAADQGYAPAFLNLGWHYDNGEGVEKNTRLALELYEKAAERGNISAMYNLVNLYRHGTDTEKNIEKAAEWYLKALKQQNRAVSESYEEILSMLLSLDDDTVIWPES